MIKKIIRKEFGIFEVVGEASPKTEFEKGKAYILGDKVYPYWGVQGPEFDKPGFFYREDVQGVCINFEDPKFKGLPNPKVTKYIMSIDDIEEVDVDRLDETIKLFEKELYKYIEIRNAVCDNKEAYFKVTGSNDSIKIMSIISAMLNGNCYDNKENVTTEVLNIKFNPNHTNGIKIRCNGETPKMNFVNHTDKIVGNFRYQFYEHE